MPALASVLKTQIEEAIRLAEIGEVARAEALAGSQTRRDLHPSRLEYLYELSYLKMFYLWEDFLEQAFTRYVCGYLSPAGPLAVKTGVTLPATLSAARAAILDGKSFVLWHNPVKVIARSQRFLTACPVQAVLQSNQTKLEQMAAIRHRVVHAQEDARQKFDAATMAIAGKRYRGARVGAFLRDEAPATNAGSRWLVQLALELQGMAAQVA